MAASGGTDIRRRTATSVLWSLLGRGSTTASTFVVFLLLARLLTPSDFGIFALASVFVDVTRIVAMSGWTDAIVRSSDLDDELLDTAFWANLGFGVVVAMIALGLALPYAAMTRQPVVAQLLWWLAPLVPLSCLGSVHVGQALHGFGYRGLALRTFVSNALGGIAAICAAMAGWGVWSLVAQALVSDIVNVVSAWISYPWMPGRRFSYARFRELLGFTSTMMMTQLLWLLLVRAPDIFIARALGTTQLGVYRIGFRMFELIGQLVVQPVAAVGITTFSRLRGNSEAIENAYARIVGLLAFIIFPVMAGFGAVAVEAIPLLFGERWQASVPVAQVLMGLMVPYLLSFFDAPIFGSVGRASSLTRIAVVQVVLTVTMSWLVAPLGLTIVAAAYVLRSFMTLPYQQYLMQRDTGISPLRIWRAIALPLIASIGMLIGTFGMRHVLTPHLHSPIAMMAALIPTGVILYAAILFASARREVSGQLAFLRSLRTVQPVGLA